MENILRYLSSVSCMAPGPSFRQIGLRMGDLQSVCHPRLLTGAPVSASEVVDDLYMMDWCKNSDLHGLKLSDLASSSANLGGSTAS